MPWRILLCQQERVIYNRKAVKKTCIKCNYPIDAPPGFLYIPFSAADAEFQNLSTSTAQFLGSVVSLLPDQFGARDLLTPLFEIAIFVKGRVGGGYAVIVKYASWAIK